MQWKIVLEESAGDSPVVSKKKLVNVQQFTND